MMTFPRRILLAATGLFPQIVTETLYALAVQPGAAGQAFLPTEIHLITTAEGARLARTALLHPDGGQFHALLANYPQLGHPVFDDAHIHQIHNAQGQPLPDIRTPEENACAADAITTLMAQLTHDPQAALHVSIAGGRKTMGFYLGYAFSLFARPQDELSHVLVSSPFESHQNSSSPPPPPGGWPRATANTSTLQMPPSPWPASPSCGCATASPRHCWTGTPASTKPLPPSKKA